MTLSEKDTVPFIFVKNQNGEKVSLGDLKGKMVVLFFYPKDMTPGCTQEACAFNDNFLRFKKKNVVIVGVSFDDEKKHQKFIEKHNLEFDLWVDESKELAKAFGVYKKKKFMGREFMGIVRSTFLIDAQSKIIKVWSPVSVKGHVDEVWEEIQKYL